MNKPVEVTEISNPGTILIVDDTPANLRLLSGMLSEQNYKTRMAPNGRLALLNAQSDPPDLILLDIKMPEMSGYEVCEQLKADPRTRDIPVIFISALDQTEDKIKAFTFGGVDYITKPFQVEEVLARVKTHLSLYSLQRQLAAANAQLEASNADLRAFAHTVAHDLKSPLGVVLGFGALLEMGNLSPEEITECSSKIVANSYKMRDIIDALLLLASVREVNEIDRTTIAMGAVVNAVLDRLEADIATTHAKMSLPETWPVVQSYAPWLEEVWANYISNALKYGGDAENNIAPEIELGADAMPAQNAYRFYIRDNGTGLSPAERAKVFTPLTRFHQERAQGHGLGLSIVKRIVEKLGGQVGVDSAGAGQGCTFWFVLPTTMR